MSQLDKATVEKIARLARLRLSPAETDKMVGELSRILTFVEQLGELDTAAVEPMTSGLGMSLRRREDVVNDGGIPEKVLANAPEAEAGFYVVPKVVE